MASGDMLRLKCSCGAYSLDVMREGRDRIKLAVPCVYCKDIHTFTVSTGVLMRDDTVRLPCPYSGQNIFFLAEDDAMSAELDASAEELSRIIASFEGEELRDIQPEMGAEDTTPPDAGIYDVLNFVMRDLEDAGKIFCPCGRGGYELRFTEDGAEAVCTSCGATYGFTAKTAASAESYLDIDEIHLS